MRSVRSCVASRPGRATSVPESPDPWQVTRDIALIELARQRLEHRAQFPELSSDAVHLVAVLGVLDRRALIGEVAWRFPERARLVAAMGELRSRELISASWAASRNGEEIELVLVLSDRVELPSMPPGDGE